MKLIQYGGDVPMSVLIVSIPFMKQFMEQGDNQAKISIPVIKKGGV